MLTILVPLALLLILCVCNFTIEAAEQLSDPGIVSWDSPGKGPADSMPLGNGEIGINAWVEEGADLCFYLSRTDTWSEHGRPLKLGRVRVTLSPNPFKADIRFRQILHTKSGEIRIEGGPPEDFVKLRLWVDANRPVVRLEAEAEQLFEMIVRLEVWRRQPREISRGGAGYQGIGEAFGFFGVHDIPEPIVQQPDVVLPAEDNRITWFHRNPSSIWEDTLQLQGLIDFKPKAKDPLLNRTFGGTIRGDGFVAQNDTTLRSSRPAARQLVSIYTHTAITDSPEQWLAELVGVLRDVERTSVPGSREAHQQWWNSFWDRSWIRVTSAGGDPHKAITISRGYALQRFISAAGGRGAFPIKFNGSIFTVDADEAGEKYDADYRRWGGGYWFQNTRLPYWAMLAAGDYDTMQPLFRMYLDALPLALHRTRAYFNHGGAYFPETMYFWGTWDNYSFGRDRAGLKFGEVQNPYVRWYFTGCLELVALALERFDFTSDRDFARTALLPLADAILIFFDEHYPRDTSGKILLQPSQSLETWQKATNPLPDIAGLMFVLPRLLQLPHELTTAQQRQRWQRMMSELPPLPRGKHDGKDVLLPAEKFDELKNVENPELYAVFPFRLFGVDKPRLEVAQNTYHARLQKGSAGWQQDPIQAAYLGMAHDAAEIVAARFAAKHPGSRFPGFWGPNFDWVPDQDHATVAMIALQAMLLQADGSRLLLFPAWPKDWDVDFKLHAPRNTVVQGSFRGGELRDLIVTPPQRRNDLVIKTPQ